MRDSRRGAEITVQSMPDVLGALALYTAHVDTSWKMIQQKQEVYLVRVGSLRYPELLHQEGPATWSQVREERRLQRIPHGKSNFKRRVERNNTKTFTIDLSVTR